MDEKVIREQLIEILDILKPDEANKTNALLRGLSEDLSYLRVVAQYVMLDKEASCREAYESGVIKGWEGKK